MADFTIYLVGSLCVVYFAWVFLGLAHGAASSQRTAVVSRGEKWKLRLDRREGGRRGSDRGHGEGSNAQVIDLNPIAPTPIGPARSWHC